jgi:AraC family transcriptional regulator
MGENGRLHEIAAEAVGMAFAAGDNGGARVGRFPWITVIADRTGKSETLADASLSVVKTEVDEEDRMTCESHNPVAIASVTTVTFHSVQGSITPSQVNPALSSTSVRVGHLVMRAMALFESNREVAWRCLRDASTLLGEEGAIGIDAPRLQSVLRPGGLAVWQARRAVQYIEGNLGSKMAIREIADCVALSPSHFSRAFKQSHGSSPMAYVAARRVERAMLMMTSTRERLTDIAVACGFADQSHLTRSFRRVVGMTPALWRRTSINLT